jgi:hypothetical protein
VSDIFISYASADRPRIKPLVDALLQKGWSVWWDRTIPPGKTWDTVIADALRDARCVIVLWSRESVQSDWVRTEADEARERRILIPALLDNVDIPLAFKRIQAANLVNWSGKLTSAEFDELARAVSQVLSNTGPAGKTLNATTSPGIASKTAPSQKRPLTNKAARSEPEPLGTSDRTPLDPIPSPPSQGEWGTLSRTEKVVGGGFTAILLILALYFIDSLLFKEPAPVQTPPARTVPFKASPH